MKMGNTLSVSVFRLVWMLAAIGLGPLAFGSETTFDQVQIGTQTYRNVTVTTKSKDYIFMVHSTGMTSVRVSELPDEVRTTLGYADLTPKPHTNTPAIWAKQTFSKLQTEQVKGVEAKLVTVWQDRLSPSVAQLPPITPRLIGLASAVVLAVYFFFCYCCMLICQKAGSNPNILIFIPVLQAFPLLRAAQMSGWWFVPWVVPGLNIVPQIIWFVKIVRARRKSAWLVLWLLLPVTNLLAFLYLAFSNGARPEAKKPSRHVPIMTLETA